MSTLLLEALQLKRDQIKAQLAQIGDMRPGSLVERYRKCGKPFRHCAQRDARGHGPSYFLTHAVRGKTIIRVIPRGAAVERTRAQIAEYHRFRGLIRQSVAVSEQICEAERQPTPADVESENKKKRARRLLGRRGHQRG